MIKKRWYKAELVNYFIICFVILIAYWQITLLQFSLKNDAITLSLPWKTFVSNSLRNGYLPIWNPYVNMGWAQGSELSTWYYPSWIFAIFGTYRLSFLHIELTIHLFLGGIGFYQLLKIFQLKRLVLIFGATTYILSGFFIGNLQHFGWINYACWLPWVLVLFYKTLNAPQYKNSIGLGLCSAMMVLSGYIPMLMHTFIFLILLLIGCIYKTETRSRYVVMFHILFSFLACVAICSPVIYMFVLHANEIWRSGPMPDAEAVKGSLTINSLLTVIFPFTTTVSSFFKEIEVSVNNLFIGIVTLLFLFFSIRSQISKKIFLLITFIGLLSLLLSLGKDSIVTWTLFRNIPIYDKIRGWGHFRLYFIMATILLSAFGLQYLLLDDNKVKKHKTLFLAFLLFTITLFAAITGTYLYKHPNIQSFPKYISNDIHHAMAFQALVFIAIITTGVLTHLLLRKSNRYNVWYNAVIANAILMVTALQMNIYNTGVASIKVTEVDKKMSTLSSDFKTQSILTFDEYRELCQSISLTEINTSTFFQVPSISNSQPYNPPEYSEIIRSQNYFAIPQTSVIYQQGNDSINYPYNEIKATEEFICSNLLLTPYGVDFDFDNNIPNNPIIIQFILQPNSIVKANGTNIALENNRFVYVIKQPHKKAHIHISIVPQYIKGIFIVSISIFILLNIIYCIIIAKNDEIHE